MSFDDAMALLDAQIATVRPQYEVMVEARLEAEQLEAGLLEKLSRLERARGALLDVKVLDGVKLEVA